MNLLFVEREMPRENPNLFEINTALWLNEASRKLGRQVSLRNVPTSERDRLEGLGMDSSGSWAHTSWG